MSDAQDLLEFIRDLRPQVSYPPDELDREPVVVMDQSLWEAIVYDAKTALSALDPQPARTFTEDEAHGITIDQRDKAEDAMTAAYTAIVGQPPEWSSAFDYADAVSDMTAALARATEAAEAKGRREALEEALTIIEEYMPEYAADMIRALIEKEG